MELERVGYLLKKRESDIAVLADAPRRIAEGESVLDPTIVVRLVRRLRDPDPLPDLTEREREVLSLIAEGRSNQGVGPALFLSPKTVESHIRQIFTKLRFEGASDDHRRVLAVLAICGVAPDRPRAASGVGCRQEESSVTDCLQNRTSVLARGRRPDHGENAVTNTRPPAPDRQ